MDLLFVAFWDGYLSGCYIPKIIIWEERLKMHFPSFKNTNKKKKKIFDSF